MSTVAVAIMVVTQQKNIYLMPSSDGDWNLHEQCIGEKLTITLVDCLALFPVFYIKHFFKIDGFRSFEDIESYPSVSIGPLRAVKRVYFRAVIIRHLYKYVVRSCQKIFRISGGIKKSQCNYHEWCVFGLKTFHKQLKLLFATQWESNSKKKKK